MCCNKKIPSGKPDGILFLVCSILITVLVHQFSTGTGEPLKPGNQLFKIWVGIWINVQSFGQTVTHFINLLGQRPSFFDYHNIVAYLDLECNKIVASHGEV